MMATEDDARVTIDRWLEQSGWMPEQVTRNEVKYPEQKRLLGKRRPDYVLYRSEGSKTPLAVIEAKRPNAKLNNALKQAVEYAQKLGCRIVYASDGNITVSRHIVSGGPLVFNNSQANYILPEKHLVHFEQNGEWERGEAFSTSGDLIRVFRSASKILNEEGIAGLNAFNEFSKLVFIKILSELRESEEHLFKNTPAHWQDFSNLAGPPLLVKYNEALAKLQGKYDDGIAQSEIERHETLSKLVGLLDGKSFIDTESDVKGDAYEYFLREYTKIKDELNRYFTPRHIIDLMVKIINPQIGERVYDPFCGTGGMLIMAFKHISGQIAKDSAQLKRLQESSIFGRDIEKETAYVAKMNMILAGDGHNNISRGDSTRADEQEAFDVVLTNIPFSKNREPDYIGHCLRALKRQEGSRAAIIVPERIICEDHCAAIRRKILSDWHVDRIVSLSKDVFAEYTSAKTSILFVSWLGDRKKQRVVDVYKVVDDGLTGKARRRIDPAASNDINEMLVDNLEPEAFPLTQPHFRFNKRGVDKISIDGATKKFGDVLVHMKRPVTIKPGDVCLEPGMDKHTSSIFVKTKKRYSQVAASGRTRNKILKGDLVVGMMHTQDGLVAFSEEEVLHATPTHAPFSIDETAADREYVFWVLREMVMKLERTDTVGREAYKVAEILALPLPLPPKSEQKKIAQKMRDARDRLRDAEAKLEQAKQEFESAGEKYLPLDFGED